MDSGEEPTPTPSLSTFGVTAVTNLIIFSVMIIVFLILRKSQPRIYKARLIAETVSKEDRPKPLTGLAWFKDLISRSESEILQEAGLDGYFFLRYLRLIFLISVVGIVCLFPILLPINATGGNDQGGLDKLSFTNVNNSKRFYAHVFLGWLFNGFILFTLYREYVYYVSIRQAVLTSPAYSSLVSSRTVLIQTLPKDYQSEDRIRRLFDGVKYVLINRTQKALIEKVEERSDLANKIELAETKLLKQAVKNRLKSERDSKKKGTQIDNVEHIRSYVPDKKRPTHKLKFLIGKKVDTIDYGKEHIAELNSEISYLQEHYKEAPPLNSAFIIFHTQEQAEVAVQVLSHHEALHMSPRYIGIQPKEVIWGNLRMFWWERLVRHWGALAFIVALVIFWSFPVAFVGMISNIRYLAQKVSWLRWLLEIPEWIFGAISGLVPTVALAVLMMLLPIVLRLMAKISGVPSLTLVEYYVQNSYFGFQIVQVFLVTTLASGAAAVVPQIIKEPTSALHLLASNIPKASNFYISYFLLQGLTIAGGALANITALLLFHVMGMFLDNTARKRWNRWNVLSPTAWGTVFPVYSNLAVITITYAIISPLILVFTAVCFGLVYFAYLYNLIFTVAPSDGRGIYYPRALSQTFFGLYIGEVCMLGLFVFGKAWGPLALEAILLGVTIFVHVTLKSAFDPMLSSLPRSLMRDTSGLPAEKQPLITSDGSVELQSLGSPTNDKSGLMAHPQHREMADAQVMPVNSEGQQPMINHKHANSSGIVSSADPDYDSESHHSPLEKMSTLGKYFMPHKYLSPQVLEKTFLGPAFRQPHPPLTEQEEETAYTDAAVTDENPIVWIPQDPYGFSDREVAELRECEVNATNQGTWFEIDQNKGKIKRFNWAPIEEVPIWSPEKKY